MKISPSSGCIPSGGAIELEIQVCPSTVGCFDVKICVNVRDSKQLSVRLSGSVEQPRISVEKVMHIILIGLPRFLVLFFFTKVHL